MKDTQSKSLALVIGLGASGKAAISYLATSKWRVRVADTRNEPPSLEEVKDQITDGAYFGHLNLDLLTGVSLVVLSPGISPYFGELSFLIKECEAKNIPVIGEIELFARELAHLKESIGYEPKILAITGTNGKTTTTLLTTHILKENGISAIAAGNVGPNAITELLNARNIGKLPLVWVLELSSFQLDRTYSLSSTAATLLNLTEDHIDWHGSLESYLTAKRRIFASKTLAVLNRDDALSFSTNVAGNRLSFGAGEPKDIGDYGLSNKDGEAHLVRKDTQGLTYLLKESSLLIAGRHNTMNALAAWALAKSVGLSDEQIGLAAKTYKGEAHRVQKIFSYDGVDIVDDSKGTNVGAVQAALLGFVNQGKRVLLIMGGDGKGQDFSPLKLAVEKSAIAVALIGKDKEKIAESLAGISAPVEKFTTLENAVSWLWSKREPDSVLLLSPACASWDMFRNYAHRSEVFISAAKKATNQ